MPSRGQCEAIAYRVAGHDASPALRCGGGGPQPLPGLAGSSVAGRFRSWSGRSGRRYTFSVYALDATSPVEVLLPVGPAVVIGVEAGAGGARAALFVDETGMAPDLFFKSERLAALRRRAGAELHLHLTAIDGAERRAIAADLAAA